MSDIRHSRPHVRPLVALAMPAIMALTLSACGEGSGSEGSGGSTTSATSSEGASEDAFADCLAEQGVELPAEGETPDPGSLDPEQMQSAMEACGDLAPSDLPSGAPSGEPDQSALDAFADCMGERRVDVEPTLEAIQQLDRDDAKVSRALEACSALLAPPGSSASSSPSPSPSS